ncbi:RNA polymerase sigma factor [Streptomyces niveus]|uniref:RNA polymerase sigma factor n=1 Tax=Streptomyces niveus TaxID=193462 RepID=UPI00371127FE
MSVRRAVEDAHRREWAAVLAATVRVTRDLDLAEECVQDAYAAALVEWARGGVPDRPGAWLTTAGRHNALDALRRAKTLRSKLHLLIEPEPRPDSEPESAREPAPAPDDRLRLVFLCCHPALAPAAQIALTLRLVCGVPTPDIARAFLVSEPTMAARVTRAKKKLVAARIPFRMPTSAELPDRLDSVLTTIHLLFTTGHTAPAGPTVTKDDLAGRALDLARMLHGLLPDEREVRGLLALLLANHARRATRTTDNGRPSLLAEQDRTAWDREAIAEAHELVLGALRGGDPGRYALQAAIAALHASAPTYAETDWEQILVLYDALPAI